ncbi:hypothetical protein GALMADRAFT_213508 [Galerina marginata CBS 339.88]|uniref:Uncharacterized protein n=1 Tax=Galerina marginata (strain CBS 339.88) TaxID=685588 RepID=A0A067SMA2_GALM3|nr:hypothetical protein GALMADRAFT_213508 [Galerina marginata CBS 339.88]
MSGLRRIAQHTHTNTIHMHQCTAASVCKRWRGILAMTLNPYRGKKVVFDVAYEPVFLDASSWSMDLEKIGALVYISPPDLQFKRVDFDVAYSSFLPLPSIFLLEALFPELTLPAGLTTSTWKWN